MDHRYSKLPISSLRPSANNARVHSRAQIGQITASIGRYGFTNPILIDEDANILAGHGRFEAAKRLGLTEVPVIHIENMSAADKRAYMLADNRLAEKAGWDKEILAIELGALVDLGYEVDLTGFAVADIDAIIGEEATKKSDPLDERLPKADFDVPAVSRPGDLWRLRDHRIICGSALDAESYPCVLAGRLADVTFTDPPYNVPIAGHVSGLGRKVHREFAMASGEMSEAEFVAFLKASLGLAAASSRDGAVHFVCMDWRHITEAMAAGLAVYGSFLNLCVWDKGSGGMGSLYRSQHELVFVFRTGQNSHQNNVELGRFGRNRTNVWPYKGLAGFGQGRAEALALHPTVKPVALVADAILDVSKRGGVVLDPFSGSGTTLLAAEKTGRRAAVIEIDPHYVDVTIKRWETATGKRAVHDQTGQTFEDMAESRRADIEATAPALGAERHEDASQSKH